VEAYSHMEYLGKILLGLSALRICSSPQQFLNIACLLLVSGRLFNTTWHVSACRHREPEGYRCG
jgi:hypothetical protein